MSRKAAISRRFSQSAPTYESNAALQDAVAEKLAGMLPPMRTSRILEIGCGTGLLTRRLLKRYGEAQFLITDVCPQMVSLCRERCERAPNAAFAAMDGDRLATDFAFDLIASSMCLQWFDDPAASLESQQRRLSPSGVAAYATIGGDNFPEWRETLEALGAPSGLLDMPALPGVCVEENIAVDYGCAENFLAALRAMGARSAREGYRPLGPMALKRACTAFNSSFGGRVTWRIAYGLIEPKP
jgi:malonyl-CoA O-methyltransferase